MRKRLMGILVAIAGIGALAGYCQAKVRGKTVPALKGKKVLLIIASNNFRDEEFEVPKDLLEEQGVKVTVAGSSLAQARGMLGLKAKADILISQALAADYDGVVFVGGSGSREYFENSAAHKIARDTIRRNKILAAICIAPVILANAGLLDSKKATVFTSEAQTIKARGAIYTAEAVERDGKIITANGPEASTEFAHILINALKE